MLRRIWGMVGLCLALAGCTTMPESRCGFELRILKPPIIVSAPGVTSVTTASSAGLTGIDHSTGLASMPAMAESATMCEGSQQRAARYFSSQRSVGVAAAGACTLDDLCMRMDRIEREVMAARQAHPSAVALPLPTGPR